MPNEASPQDTDSNSTTLSPNSPVTSLNSLTFDKVLSSLCPSPVSVISSISPHHHPLLSSSTPSVIYTYPSQPPLQALSQAHIVFVPVSPTPAISMAKPAKKTHTSSQSTSSTKTATPKEVKPQMAWGKDTNSEGKTPIDLIVKWLCFTWGDQEGPSDAAWMCMENYDHTSTNHLRYQASVPKKRECADRCAIYLRTKGFPSAIGPGVAQQITTLEQKFHKAESWQGGTGGGVYMDQAENEIQALPSAVQDRQWDSDKEEEIRALAAKRTKDVILSHCSYYDVLLPIMGNHPNNLPLASAKTPAPLTSNPLAPLTSGEWTPSNTINLTPSNAINLTSGQLLPMDESQSTHHTQPLHHAQPNPNETIEPNVQSQQSQRSPSCQFQTPARNKVSSNLGQTPKTGSRQSSGSAAVLKSMKSSLPMAKSGLQTASNKHSLEEEDPNELANKKAKWAKQDELNLIRTLESLYIAPLFGM
ncbi:hypothetical protein DFH28DRAFT_1223969 [Melampsora americana]|nr:hypothetical protein DFH28DRAFT_1223969 [Melampsora americana]